MNDKEKKHLRNIAFATFGLAIFVAGVYFGANITSYLEGIKIFFATTLILLSFYIILKILIPTVTSISDPESVTDDFSVFLIAQVQN